MFEIVTRQSLYEKWVHLTGALPAVLMGASYGVVLRLTDLLTHLPADLHVSIIMTISFLACGPLAIGYLVVRTEARRSCVSLFAALVLLTWPAAVLTALITWLLNIEGFICIVFAMPVMLIGGSVGGFLAWAMQGRGRRDQTLSAALVVCVPLAGASIEVKYTPPLTYRTVVNEVWINAPPEMVWRNIERVRAIAPGELRETWAQRIGFPRPLEATLSYEGVGGVRHASFERGLMFVETVTA